MSASKIGGNPVGRSQIDLTQIWRPRKFYPRLDQAMLYLLSPAKKLDYQTDPLGDFTIPELMTESEKLMGKLKKLSSKKVGELMNLSEDLSKLNYDRFQQWKSEMNPKDGRQALIAFKGDVFVSMKVEEFKKRDFTFAQKHLRILSGLHGVLRPLDLMRPYRLEMGTKLSVDAKTKNLYQFWGTKISQSLNDVMKQQKDKTLVNLASNEYYKAVDKKSLEADRILNVSFKDLKNGKYKAIFLWVKQARGMMASWAIRNRITKIEDLKAFDGGGYQFSPQESTDSEFVFLRDPTASS